MSLLVARADLKQRQPEIKRNTIGVHCYYDDFSTELTTGRY